MGEVTMEDIDDEYVALNNDEDISSNDPFSGPVWELLNARFNSMMAAHVEKEVGVVREDLHQIKNFYETEQRKLVAYWDQQLSKLHSQERTTISSNSSPHAERPSTKMMERLTALEEKVEESNREHIENLNKQIQVHHNFVSRNSMLNESHASAIDQLLKDMDSIFMAQSLIMSELSQLKNNHSKPAMTSDMEARLLSIERIIHGLTESFSILSDDHQNLVKCFNAIEHSNGDALTTSPHTESQMDDGHRGSPLSLELMQSRLVSVEERLNYASDPPQILFDYHQYLSRYMHVIQTTLDASSTGGNGIILPERPVDGCGNEPDVAARRYRVPMDNTISDDSFDMSNLPCHTVISIIPIPSPDTLLLSLISSFPEDFFRPIYGRQGFAETPSFNQLSVVPVLVSARILLHLDHQRRLAIAQGATNMNPSQASGCAGYSLSNRGLCLEQPNGSLASTTEDRKRKGGVHRSLPFQRKRILGIRCSNVENHLQAAMRLLMDAVANSEVRDYVVIPLIAWAICHGLGLLSPIPKPHIGSGVDFEVMITRKERRNLNYMDI